MTEEAIKTARELATHASDIRHLQDDMDKMLESMKTMQATLTAIDKTLSEAKGGWKMLMLVGGAGGVVGSFLTYLANWLPSK
jgi:prefoldin subunit 5|tara:strand:- start:593 stop:838 length:246 start_codon:yes stop_codon:yes gene_type:complete